MEALKETTENTWHLNTADSPLSCVIEKALRFPKRITIKGKETLFLPMFIKNWFRQRTSWPIFCVVHWKTTTN
jgi:hypothetical protein